MIAPVYHLIVSRLDYVDFRTGCSDGDGLPLDYDSFIKLLNDFSENMRANGAIAVQVNIKPQDFFAWCVSRGIKTDSRARSVYAAIRHHQLSKQ